MDRYPSPMTIGDLIEPCRAEDFGDSLPRKVGIARSGATEWRAAAIERLRLIRFAREAGLKLTEVKSLVGPGSSRGGGALSRRDGLRKSMGRCGGSRECAKSCCGFRVANVPTANVPACGLARRVFGQVRRPILLVSNGPSREIVLMTARSTRRHPNAYPACPRATAACPVA